ncbi:helix-turn-helix and ligand-binding sensor domain-containing protein [Winogradskyella arenosi]|uniref:Regulatory LuxR family protein n=1 Tax=Winogradskyella arenosi TaxID=533325 RepID=A0A368ZJV8_9FLAO|nr:triple tyrosine motif-containing protein [Winogradskyella arenosi]RCW94014.1 regulatory LuxR family protein [Winogradskyella arenosi]
MLLLKNFKIYVYGLCVALCCGLASYAQEIPPIQIFTPQDYNAEDQNWAISQSDSNFIYVANNRGLLEYNGALWKLYNSPNDGILRSVKVVGDRIYTGGYMDFGYWTKNNKGTLEYSSLSKNKNFSIREDEEFWGLLHVEGFVLFQSFERIYIYNIHEDRFDIINSDYRINKMFKVGETVYFQKTEVGIFKIENGKKILILPEDAILGYELVNIFPLAHGLLMQSKEHGFYKFENNSVSKWEIPSDPLLSTLSVYSSIRLADGGFLLGTIANGIIQLDASGAEVLAIDQWKGLSNNTVLSVFEDSYGSVWLGLDNGINLVNLKSPFRVYTDSHGVLGTVYAAAKTDRFLYLGTNQGLFYQAIDSNVPFKMIDGTKGQVWSLSMVQDDLFCGHDKGTFIIENTTATQVSDIIGTWGVKPIKGRPNLLIQGNYKGLNVLEKNDGTWQYRNRLQGFNISSKYFELLNAHEVFVSHEHKGVYKITLDSNYRTVKSTQKMPVAQGVKSGMVKYNNDILYSNRLGVYKYKASADAFQKDSVLSALFTGDKYISGKLFNDVVGNKLWGYSKSELVFVEPGKLSSEPEINVIALSSEVRKSKSGYENILYLGPKNYLIGTTDGFLKIDLDKVKERPLEIHLNSVNYGAYPDQMSPLDLSNTEPLRNKYNNVRFNYSVTNYNQLSTSKFQSRLLGFYDDWSDWSTESEIFYKNLPYGEYTFQARALTDGVLSKNIVSYVFSIKKPWYLTPLAIVLYVVVVLLIIYVLYFYNRRHFKKQQLKIIEKKERELALEQLESQRQLIQFKNQNLQLDIENKNRELGMATMNLVKRNELLGNIKEQLANSKSMPEVNNVIKLINKSINNTGDWQLFEEAFNNVDKDFMKKIKALHPSITASDLRLCAYLRLNLSSKEIAPLLNISHKSVEVKRYRLRKKLELDHDRSLSSYIIEL